MTTRLKNRHEGGRLLARLLADYAGGKDVVVLAISSGGAPVAAALARELVCPMDVLVVRTLNVPHHDPWEPEIVMGAVASGGVRVLDFGVMTSSKVQAQELEQVTAFEERELDRLQRLYRDDRPFPDLRGRITAVAFKAYESHVDSIHLGGAGNSDSGPGNIQERLRSAPRRGCRPLRSRRRTRDP